ncbi:MAG: hypothetical protein ABR969_00720 [Sedimentisphaerales bacterium]|jgi:hypothetical protein
MGWTHYWQRDVELPAKPFAEAVADCKKIFKLLTIPIGNAQGKGEPLLTDDKMEFNCADGYGCEPFIINRIQQPRHGRTIVAEYCKTEHLPYDLCVQCALIILQHHLAIAIKVMSDGTDYDWDEARRMCVKYLGYGNNFCLGKALDS